MGAITTSKDQIAKYLALGYKATEVAQIFNLSDGYISQLSQEEGFKELVNIERAKRNTRAIKIDETYELIEEYATDTILARAKQGFYKPTELLAVAAMANKASRKSAPGPQAESGDGLYARITLPANLLGIEIIRTAQNQVLRVGETSLNPMSKSSLNNLAEDVEVKAKPVKSIEREELSEAAALLANHKLPKFFREKDF
jgi:ribosome-binding protein aMBF1 (putative translation factor)